MAQQQQQSKGEVNKRMARWSDELYEARMPEMVAEVNSRFCCLTEWTEQPMPAFERDVRETLRRSEPFLSSEILEALPKEDVPESGPLDILVFGDSSGLMIDVLRALKDRKKLGRKTKTLNLWDHRDHMSRELIGGYVADGPWDLIVFAGALDMPQSNEAEDVAAWTDVLVKAYMYLGQVLIKELTAKPNALKKGLVTLTADVFGHRKETHEKAGVGICVGGFLFGASNTMRMEMPNVPIHYVDIDFQVDDILIGQLASEITRTIGFGENSVKLSAQARYVARAALAEPKYSTNLKFRTPQKGTIAIGGGNGALGLVMGKFFLEKIGSGDSSYLSILFLSRSTKVSGDQNLKAWEEIQSLAELKGVTVLQAKCDVTSRDAVEAFAKEQGQNLVGFVHSAGLLRDGLLVNQTDANYDDVYKPKAYAALYLHSALNSHNPNLEFFWMFSSVAVFGNPGQSNYSGANAFLDSLARHRKAQGQPATVVQWAGWGEVGMASQLEGIAKQRMMDSPMPLFTNAQGLEGMQTGLSTGLPVFCVLKFNADAFFNMHNKDSLKTPETYSSRFWGTCAPKQSLDELDLYECVLNAFHNPHSLQYDHFIDQLQDPFDKPYGFEDPLCVNPQ